MPKSRSAKEVLMGDMTMMKPQDMAKEGKQMMVGAKNSMMRGRAMMMGAQAMMKKKKMPNEEMDEMMEYSDLGGLNFDPKKMRRKRH